MKPVRLVWPSELLEVISLMPVPASMRTEIPGTSGSAAPPKRKNYKRFPNLAVILREARRPKDLRRFTPRDLIPDPFNFSCYRFDFRLVIIGGNVHTSGA